MQTQWASGAWCARCVVVAVVSVFTLALSGTSYGQICDVTPDHQRCLGQCGTPGDQCVPKEILADANGAFLEIVCCDCEPSTCHMELDPASLQFFCVSDCPNPANACTLVGKGNIDGTITYSCDCIDQGTPQQCEWVSECNFGCQPGTCSDHCKGPCPQGTQQACVPVSLTEPPPPQPGPPPVVCDCVDPGTNPCRLVLDIAGPQCIGQCPVGTGPCQLITTQNPDGSLTYSCDPCDPPPPAACEPDSTGTACTSNCLDPNQQCVPKEILADAFGNFIEITCCECQDPDPAGLPTCHLNYNPATNQITCEDPCPDPNRICTRVGKGNLDGTITYTCECFGASDPTSCDFVSECNPCVGGSCVKRCTGPCPPPYDACLPDAIILHPDGSYTAGCGCGDPATDTCRPRVDPVSQQVICDPPCPGGLPCPPPQVIQNADGTLEYRCPPCGGEPIGACCIQHQGGSSYCVEITAAQCQLYGGLYMGDGTLCINVQCPQPSGACCRLDECDGYICTIETLNDCNAMGGYYQGNNTTCMPVNPCVEETGACCVPDGPPPAGTFCTIVTARECNDLFGYYHGDGTTCSPDPCEEQAPSCGTASCCQRPPRFNDPNYAGFTGPVAVVTSEDYINPERLWVIDIKDKASAALNTHFSGAARYSHPSWTSTNLGSVFGVTLDRPGNIYVTASTSFSISAVGPGGPGAVYRIDAVTGAVSTFATLPNTGPGLGNIAYDCVCRQFFVTNFEDGKIYRINAAGAIMQTYDHGVPDNGSPGFAPLGDRPWGVHVYNRRVYYGIWEEDFRVSTTANNTVWSVPLKGCEFDLNAGATLEITLPNIPSGSWGAVETMPVADFAFSTDGCMLLAERSMYSDTGPSAHLSRVLEYRWNGFSWIPSGHNFDIGYLFGGIVTNAAGGVDYEIDGSMWATGDALQFGPQYIYGLQNTPGTGGTVFQSVLIDVNGDYVNVDKTLIGDVEIPCLPCVKPPTTLVGWWPLDEPTGPTAADMTTINPGTHTNGPTVIPGMVSRALRFDGVNDRVNVPDNNTLDFASVCTSFFNCTPVDISIDAWIRTCKDTGTQPIVDKLKTSGGFFSSTQGYSFYLNNGVLELQLGDQALFFGGGLTAFPDSSATNVADGQWHHVAVTVDRDQANGGTFYVDGVAVSTFNPTPRNKSLANAVALWIGAKQQPVSHFEGDIDEVQIFRRVVPAAEIAAIYRAWNAGKCKDRCHVPSVLSYCINQSTKVTTLTICNDSPGAQTYNWMTGGLPVSLPDCSVAGPTIFSPASGSVAVPAGQCVSVNVTITAPPGLTVGQTACYGFWVTNIYTGNTTTCGGQLKRTQLWCGIKWDVLNPIEKLPVGTAKTISFQVTNDGDTDETFEYEVHAVPHESELGTVDEISINGLPPGDPVIDSVTIPVGQSARIDVDVTALAHEPFEFFDIELHWDVDATAMANRSEAGGPPVKGEAIGVYTVFVAPSAPLAASAPHDRTKNRYVSFSPNGSSELTAYRVYKVTDAAGPIGWVGAPDANGIAQVVSTPVMRVWTESVVFVGDCEIVPVAVYEIVATENLVIYSEPVMVTTIAQPSGKDWGDTVGSFDGVQWTPPNEVVNTNDFIAALQGFQNLPSKPHVTVTDVQSVSAVDPCLNKSTNIADVFLLIKAFQGENYPFTKDPTTCPTCP